MSKSVRPGPPEPQFNGVPHLNNRQSFKLVEEKAREVLRERGLSDKQIEWELSRVKRRHLEN